MDFKKIQNIAIVVDAHCDTLTKLKSENRSLGELSTRGHIDLPRLRKGGVNVQFFAAFIAPEYSEALGIQRTLEIINLFHQECEKYKELIAVARSKKEILEAIENNKLAGVLSIEGGEALGGKLFMLSIFYQLGVRCLTLTWNGRNSIADGVGQSRTKGGLTTFGIKVVQEMNRLGMLVDISHLSEAGFWDVLAVSQKPIIATHSNCASVCEHRRNLKDDQIKALATKGGVIGLTLVPEFIAQVEPNIEKFLDHIDYAVSLVGARHVGIGSDFDGIDQTLPDLINCTMLPKITKGLVARGYNDEDIKNILGLNLLRVFETVVG